MLKITDYIWADADIKKLSHAIAALNREICQGKKILDNKKMSNSSNIAEIFMLQFLKKEGPLYSKVLHLEEKNSVARHIMATALNMENAYVNTVQACAPGIRQP